MKRFVLILVLLAFVFGFLSGSIFTNSKRWENEVSLKAGGKIALTFKEGTTVKDRVIYTVPTGKAWKGKYVITGKEE